MACDRFVVFKDKPVPLREDVGKVLEDYLGPTCISCRWLVDRWSAMIIGTKSWPFRRVSDPSSASAKMHAEEWAACGDRWIEVVFGKDNIDVITRQQDELVNTIASGFATLVERHWGGQLEDDK